MDTMSMDNKRGASNINNPPPLYEALTETQVNRCLQLCASATEDYLLESFPVFWGEWIASVEKREENARSNKEQIALAELIAHLKAGGSNCLQQFQRQLKQNYIDFSKQQLTVASGQERFSQNVGLSLVDNAELEETIAITSISHRADSQFAEVLWALHQRLALLNGGRKVDERSNPVSPIQLCDSLRRVLQELHLDARTKVLGYKQFEQGVIRPVTALYQSLNEALIAEGILPNLRYSAASGVSGSSSTDMDASDAAPQGDTDQTPQNTQQEMPVSEQNTAPERQGRRATDRAFEPLASDDPQQYQQGLVSAIRLLQTHLGGGSTGGAPTHPAGAGQPAGFASGGMATNASHGTHGGGFTGGVPTSFAANNSPAAVSALSGDGSAPMVGAIEVLQSQLATSAASMQELEVGDIQPLAVATVSEQLVAELEKQSPDGVCNDDMNTIELVGLVFAYILNDEQLPDSVKALLSYLHTPVLKLAFIDKEFFDNVDHPARLLLNQMAEAGSRWVGNDGSNQYNIFEKIKTTVFHVLEHFVNDVKVFAEALLEFSSYARNVSRRQELMEKRALEKARGEEKLREAKIRVNSDISACIDGKALPSPILLLLLLPWSDYLSFIILRYGADSDSYRQALAVADELLWCIEPKSLEADRVKQLEVQGDLLHTLQSGFETIGYEQNKSRKLIDAVSSLQRLALKSQQVEPAPDTMRNKLERMAADKAGQVKPEDQQVTPEEAQLIEKLKLIEFGTWLENDKGQRIKVAWYNHKTMHYMLVDQQGRKVSMLPARALAREMIAGKLRVIAGSAKPFFERALENIFQSLNARASDELLSQE
ncbi:DUF1631 family protein [Gilvimarinus polysaccharolyticus]|uniref:DUF1631 family protein n=1 Tax=Gilvimarinus polysaccharolyticus TaxID=863921 RepID=UPI000B07EE42|nr:DUF1631 family protein [Gilvimarinus polysaccharolyticus]